MASQAQALGVDFEIADLRDVPFFNADTEDDKNEATIKILEQMKAADAFVLASPEYNYSMAPALKNALEWGSRLAGNEGFKGKAASLISSGGGMRGSRSQYHARQVAVFLDLFVLNKPEVFLSSFDGTFDKESSELVSERAQGNFSAIGSTQGTIVETEPKSRSSGAVSIEVIRKPNVSTLRRMVLST